LGRIILMTRAVSTGMGGIGSGLSIPDGDAVFLTRL
jgi:hypothetical protein